MQIQVALLRVLQASLDFVLSLCVYIFVYFLRFEGSLPHAEVEFFWFGLTLLPALRLMSNYMMGLYSHLWEFVGLRELFSIFKATLLGSALFILATYLLGFPGFPRSIFVFEAGFYVLVVGGVRFSRRFSREVALFSRVGHVSRTLIIGAGDAGAMVAKDMLRNPSKGFKPVGFVDDNPQKWKAQIHGLKVFGDRAKLPVLIPKHDIQTVIIAMPSVSRKVIKNLVKACREFEVDLKIVPATHQILSGEVKIEQLRTIQIEDLLGREPIQIADQDLSSMIKGQRVLVSGAGGSIGSELCRQILYYEPAQLVLMGHGENSIYQLCGELKSPLVHPVIADIKNAAQLAHIFETYRPELVYHAAAHKHVPLMELNPVEAFLNNVFGSYNLMKTAQQKGAQKMVLISTDKAAHPSCMMGLSKYFAELAMHYVLESQVELELRAVRFGNVIGSRGSVIPLFQKQIEAGGPITVTDMQATRYFMTIPEAVQLVLQASVLQDDSHMFILDMGEPVKILDLAKNMIELTGLKKDEIDIQEIGLRPGEKRHETLVWNDEILGESSCEHIQKASLPETRLDQHLALVKQTLTLLIANDLQGFEHYLKHTILPLFELDDQGNSTAL